jgi:hypothetical protein
MVGFAVAVMMLGASRPATAQETLVDYGVDVVTNYVSRGKDLFVSVYDKERESHGSFLVAPALQPWATFYGESGLFFGLWGSWALAERDPEAATATTSAFAGLKTLDEIDYTVGYAWENKVGSFSAGVINYAAPNAAGTAGSGITEVYFSWGLPVLETLAPTLTHYSDIGNSATYTKLGIGGGETVSWAVSLGQGTKKLQDVTGKVGYGFGDFSVALNASYRPNGDILGPYNGEGKYTPAGGTALEDYPAVVAWLTLSYAGAVTE